MSYREKARLFQISTVVVMVLATAAIVALPFFMRVILYKLTNITAPPYVVGFTVASYVVVLPFMIMMYSVYKIFSNISNGMVYNQSNVYMLNRIAACAGIQGGMAIAAFVLVDPIFGHRAGTVCLLGLLMMLAVLALSIGFAHFLKAELLQGGGEGTAL